MNAWSRFVKRLGLLLGRKRFFNELDEEMAFHRAEAEKAFAAEGLTPEQARYAAVRQFGNATKLRGESHEVVAFGAETVAQDLRFALRQMRRNPGFAVTATLILALGMGASVAIFGFVDAALLQPLPYAQPNRLMSVDEATVNFPHGNLSRADYEDWKRLNKSFSSLDAYDGTGFLLGSPSGAVPVPAARVSGEFFSTLGVKTVLGRVFLPGEDAPGKPKIAMLSYGTWAKRFGGRSNVVGQALSLSGENYTIVGVLPRDFEFAPRGNAEIWVPLLDKNGCDQRRSCHNLDGIGRLRDGVTEKAAQADLSAIAAQLEREYPGSNRGQGASVIPLTELVVGKIRPILLTLLGAAGLLLLIACLNVASLVLVRSESRRREIAVRGALGATQARLMRQFATEAIAPAAAGCLLGVMIATWVMKLMAHMIPENMAALVPFMEDAGLNLHTWLFAGAIAIMAALLLAATPTVRLSFSEIRSGLTDGGRSVAGRLWRRLGANLVVVELAVAVVLLACAGLLGQSFYKLLHVDTGFDPTHLATVQVMAPDNVYAQDAKKVELYREVERRMGRLPGVQSVGITSILPMQCNCNTDWIRFVGKPYHGEHNEVDERDVSAGYLTTLKTRLIKGRFLTEADDTSKPMALMINEALARRYFPGEDPIGKLIGDDGLTPNAMRRVVGVVADVREGAPDDQIWPAEYDNIDQQPDSEFSVVVRSAQDPKAVLPEMVKALRQIDSNLGVLDEITMEDQIDASQTALLHRIATWMVGGFAAMALVLSVVGLYGVISYSVSQRTREIGVRMALGAKRGAVYRLVMSEAGRLTLMGAGVGLACSVGTSLLMRKLLFGVQAWDAATLAGVAMVLGTASMAASFLPARRAASVNPTDALRAE